MNSIQVQEYGDIFSLEIKNKTTSDIRKIIDRLNEKYCPLPSDDIQKLFN